MTRGGNAFAVKASHFLATSALMAPALLLIDATVIKANPATKPVDFRLANMVFSWLLRTEVAWRWFKLAHPNVGRDVGRWRRRLANWGITARSPHLSKRVMGPKGYAEHFESSVIAEIGSAEQPDQSEYQSVPMTPTLVRGDHN